MAYRIRNWDKHFESHVSRKLKRLDWVRMPVKLDGEGYTYLVDHANGASHLGAWLAMVEVAAGQRERGTIPEGIGGVCATLSRMSRISVSAFEELLPRLLDLEWIEEYELSPLDFQKTADSGRSAGDVGRLAGDSGKKAVAEEKRREEKRKNICASDDARQGTLLDETPADNSGVVRPAVPSKKVLTSQQEVWFGEWWPTYWRRKSRGTAEKMFGRYVKSEETFRKVLAATKAQTPEMLSRSEEHRPYGASWLNARGWEDESLGQGSGIAPSASYVPSKAKYFDIREITG